MLIAGAALMILAAVMFATTRNFYLLLAAATIGVISPSGKEVGPFLSIEQASLTQLAPNQRRTSIFAWYNLAGSFATALGALAGGGLSQLLQQAGVTPLLSYRLVVLGYGVIGLLMIGFFGAFRQLIEVSANRVESCTGAVNPSSTRLSSGYHRSQKVVFRLAALFSLDAFAGGFRHPKLDRPMVQPEIWRRRRLS